MAAKTPPIGLEAVFETRSPFKLNPLKYYKVEGHASVRDVIASGFELYQLVYAPVGLDQVTLNNDILDPEYLIISLVDEDGNRILIPNVYITGFPTPALVPHSWIVATSSLGVLPEDFDLTRVAEAMKETISDFIGVEPTVFFAKKATHDLITQDVAEQLEEIRQAAIKNRETSYSSKLALERRVAEQQDQIEELLSIIDTLSQTGP